MRKRKSHVEIDEGLNKALVGGETIDDLADPLRRVELSGGGARQQSVVRDRVPQEQREPCGDGIRVELIDLRVGLCWLGRVPFIAVLFQVQEVWRLREGLNHHPRADFVAVLFAESVELKERVNLSAGERTAIRSPPESGDVRTGAVRFDERATGQFAHIGALSDGLRERPVRVDILRLNIDRNVRGKRALALTCVREKRARVHLHAKDVADSVCVLRLG